MELSDDDASTRSQATRSQPYVSSFVDYPSAQWTVFRCRSRTTDERPSASSISFEPVRQRPVAVQCDPMVINLNSPAPATTKNMENPNDSLTTDVIFLHDCSTDQITLNDSVTEPKILNPWNPISDEVDATLEGVLNQVESVSDSSIVYSPATVRRTETELMAARLPKIALKTGRFRLGKPISPSVSTTAANEYRPLSASQSRSSPSNTTTEQPNSSPRPLDTSENPINLFTQDITETSVVNEGNENVSFLIRSDRLSLISSDRSERIGNQSRIR